MIKKDRVAVCSRSFSRHPILRGELMSRYAHVTFNDSGQQLEGECLINFLKGHKLAITGLEKINDEILHRLPELEVIAKYGVGLDMIDLNAMRRHKKRLGWTGGVNCRSVAELTLAFSIIMIRKVALANKSVVDGTWHQIKGGQLTGKTVGIIGCGNAGKDFIRLLHPFGCNILVNDVNSYPSFYSEFNVKPVELTNLLAQSDIVSIHVPLDQSTRNMMSAERLALMRPTSILINVARGNIVDENALKQMLISNKLAAAAFDVFTVEPPRDIELLRLPNFFATPHIGGSSEEAILAMGFAAINGLEKNSLPL